MVGDAAGLVDASRGVGTDAAALSGRLVAKALSKGGYAIKEYSRLMIALVRQTTMPSTTWPKCGLKLLLVWIRQAETR